MCEREGERERGREGERERGEGRRERESFKEKKHINSQQQGISTAPRLNYFPVDLQLLWPLSCGIASCMVMISIVIVTAIFVQSTYNSC